MKRMLLLGLAVVMTFSLATAQTTKIVIGPLDGEDAGAIVADTNETIDVDIWIRTAPGINIVGLHLPMASKDEYIQGDSREQGEAYYPLPVWDDASFLAPGEDAQNEGYTNHSYLGIKDLIGDPDSISAINTNGEFSPIMYFTMTTAGEGDGIPHNDAFIMGAQLDNGGMVWVDFVTGEMDNGDIEVSIATLELPDTYVGIDDEIDIPLAYSLSQNYPNPFNASTTINYSILNDGFVTVDVYDIIGRKIETLVSGHQNAGQHSVVWNANNVSSGVYFYRITSDNYSETRRCNLLK